MEHITDYKHNDKLRRQFNQLTQETFGFDFENWYQHGFWDARTICHSFVESEQIIANVSTTRFELLLNGRKFNAIQIGTVMTKPEFRGKGLGVQLMSQIIDTYQSEVDFFYLIGHQAVWNYYEKQGFVPIVEYGYEAEIENGRNLLPKLRKLNLSHPTDLDIILRLTKTRVPVSQTFGIVNDTSIFLFYCLYVHSNNLYYDETKDCLLVFAVEEQEIHLYDVLCPTQLTFAEVSAYLCVVDSDASRIVFHFAPTYPDYVLQPSLIESNDRLFFRGDVSILPAHFKVSEIAYT